MGGRRHHLRAQHDRHPRPRRLHLRGQPVARRLRGRDPAGGCRAGHRGADAGEPLPRARERSADHPGAQQDRPAGGRSREVREGARQPDRRQARGRAAGQRQDRHRRRRAARTGRSADPRPEGRPDGAVAGDDLRLGVRLLPRSHHVRPHDRRHAEPARAHPDDVDARRPRAARDRRLLTRADPDEGARRRRGRLPDHRREGRAPVEGGRHRHQRRQALEAGAARLHRPEADGLLGAVPDRRQRLPGAARGARQAQAVGRLAQLRARDLRRPRASDSAAGSSASCTSRSSPSASSASSASTSSRPRRR